MNILVFSIFGLVFALALLMLAAVLLALGQSKPRCLCATCAEAEGDRRQLHAAIYGHNIGRRCDLCGRNIDN